jgi:hypothetical protein
LDAAQRLAWAYNGDDRRRGAFAYKARGGFGKPVRKADVLTLHRALVLAVLDANDAGRKRQRTYTTEHASIWGHPLKDPSFTVVDSGGLIGTRTGISLDRSQRVPEPLALTDGFGREWDAELADAAYAALASRTPFGARLGRAIYWLGHANENADVPSDVRIFSLRTGFEMLFDAGSVAETLAEKVDDLLDPSGPRPVRHYTSRHGNPRSKPLGDRGWWFLKFSHLRNDITHDVSVPARAWRWGREHHFAVGDRQLRASMRHFLVQELGRPAELKLAHSERLAARRHEQALAILRRHGL